MYGKQEKKTVLDFKLDGANKRSDVWTKFFFILAKEKSLESPSEWVHQVTTVYFCTVYTSGTYVLCLL